MPCYHPLVLQAMTLRLTPKLKSDSSEQFAVVSHSTPSLATPIQTDSPVASRTRSKDLQNVLVVTVTIYYPIPSQLVLQPILKCSNCLRVAN